MSFSYGRGTPVGENAERALKTKNREAAVGSVKYIFDGHMNRFDGHIHTNAVPGATLRAGVYRGTSLVKECPPLRLGIGFGFLGGGILL